MKYNMALNAVEFVLFLERYAVNFFLLYFIILSMANCQFIYPHRFPHKNAKTSMDVILANAPLGIKLLLLKDVDPQKKPTPMNDYRPRRVGVESLVLRRQNHPGMPGEPDDINSPLPPAEIRDDDSNMRLKLFRLMYETVRDSDLKVKRAELIRKHYSNSTSFEVGYLMGEIQEKFDVIVEFSGTLKKFYNKWKPIEHINAYEQIANYGIQINHLTDLIRTISKNGSFTS